MSYDIRDKEIVHDQKVKCAGCNFILEAKAGQTWREIEEALKQHAKEAGHADKD